MNTVALEIRGMTCSHCVMAVDKALKKLPGVSAASVEVGRATVTVDPDVTTGDRLVDAVQDAGYDATVV
jgi:copper chaperone CopZ